MKNKIELLQEIQEENLKGRMSREVDLLYHKEILIPRHKKLKDKKLSKQRVDADNADIKNLEILIDDMDGIHMIISKMIVDLADQNNK